jgi:methylase of polypeptide subunit release factors
VSALAWCAKAWRPLSRSRGLAQRLFHVDFPRLAEADRYFDITTPLLVHSVARGLTPRSRVLDMGTGPFAVIGLALWRRAGCQVLSTDIHPWILERARENVRLNGAPIRVVHSRFFDEIDESFDAVVFNPPYVPTDLARGQAWTRTFDFQSDGGSDGTSVIAAFLAAFAAKGGQATAYLGWNGLLIPRDRVAALLRDHTGLRLSKIDALPFSPFCVLVVERTS